MKTPKISPLFFIGFIAALAGLLFGLGVGVISGAVTFIQQDFQISDQLIEVIVVALLWGALFGTLITGMISNRWGRKKTMVLSALIFIIGSLFCSISPSPTILIAARFIFGIAVGMVSFTAPVYISEIAPQKIRGSMISLYLLMIALGLVAAFLSNTLISNGFLFFINQHSPWHLMLGIVALPALITLFGMFFLPESPRWLFLKGFQEQGILVLKKIGLSHEESLQEQKEITTNLHKKQNAFVLFMTNVPFRRALALGFTLQIIQQLTGINIVWYYAPRIFKIAGFANTSEQLWGTVFLGIINIVATLVAIFFVDKLGRKPMMTFGLVIMGVSLAMVGCFLKMDLHSSPALGNYAIGALLLFIFGFGISAGPVIWILCSEIFPLAGRDLGVTFSTSANWISNSLVGGTFLTLIDKMGTGNTFLFYGALQIVSLIFFFLFVPETKNISLEKIEANLLSGLQLRKIGR